MENPASWGEAEKIVDATISNHYDLMRRGVCGLSLARQITDALRAAHLLKEIQE